MELAHDAQVARMGPELLIFPLALLGFSGLVLAAVLVARARGRTWMSLLLIAALVLSIPSTPLTGRWDHAVSGFLATLGLFTIVTAAVLAIGSLLLLPFKPQLSRLYARITRRAQSTTSPRP
jgi:hypothetical protein